MSQADTLKRPDEVPADIRLPPAQAEARRAGVRVMVRVPILAPSSDLERTKPPYVHAGILDALFGMSEVREAIDEALHVQRVDQANRADPKETHPAEAQQGS